jgi:hypothetical protein
VLDAFAGGRAWLTNDGKHLLTACDNVVRKTRVHDGAFM